MSASPADEDKIDQSDFEEFAGIDKSKMVEEEEEVTTPVEEATKTPLASVDSSWQLDAEHTFVQEHFCKVTSCEYCGNMIIAIRWHQGLRCKECQFDCHYECAPMASKNCLALHEFAPLRPDILQPHQFYEKHFSRATFCNICRKMLYGVGKQGFACATCQMISHEDCLKNAPINCPPQKLEAPLASSLKHFWVEGNLVGECAGCNQSLSKLTILFGFRCTYCTLKVCPTCFSQYQHQVCDEGPFASIKLGPGNIITNASDQPKKWDISVSSDRRPLMVFINKRSGGQVGQIIAQRLSRCINPVQIIDLSQGGPMPMLRIMQKTKSAYRVLACGGDGTAAWLLSAVDQLADRGEKYLPPIAVLPLGTGNDLARCLGWGGGYDSEAMPPILQNVIDGDEVYLDRWKIHIENTGADEPKHPKIMNNYFSIGIDAKIALDFHRKREANPSQFKSRNMNKVIYAGLGAAAVFESAPNISNCIQVELDGQPLALPSGLEGIMILNLPSWAGGKNPWGNPSKSENWGPQSPCDGLFELLGVTGSSHLAQIQGHIADGLRLGQGRQVKFTWLTTDTLPIQLDGEPWEEPPSTITVSFFRQSRMICNTSRQKVWSDDSFLQAETFVERERKPKSEASSSSDANGVKTEATIPEIVEYPANTETTQKHKRSKSKSRKSNHVVEASSSDETPKEIHVSLLNENIPPPERRKLKRSNSNPCAPVPEAANSDEVETSIAKYPKDDLDDPDQPTRSLADLKIEFKSEIAHHAPSEQPHEPSEESNDAPKDQSNSS